MSILTTPSERIRAYVASLPTSRFRTVALIAIPLLFMALAFVYRRYSMIFGTHSDYTNFLLQADAVLHGNPLLRHWYLTTVTYYTTDVLFFTIGMAIRGYDPVLVHEVPAVVFTLTLAAAVWLARTPGGQRRWFGPSIAFVLLGLPPPPLASQLLLGTLHLGMMFLLLISFLAIDVRSRDNEQPLTPLRLVLFSLFLMLAVVGDTMALYVAVAPILLVTLIRAATMPRSRRADLILFAASLAAVVGAKLFMIGIRVLDGFKMPDMYSNHAKFAAFSELGRNIGWTIEGLQSFYKANFWGMPLDANAMLTLVRSIGPLVLVWVMAAVLKQFCKQANVSAVSSTAEGPTVDRLSAILSLGMAFNLATYTFSNLQVGVETVRYLVPFAVMGAILTGRWGPLISLSQRRLFVIALSAYTVVAAGTFGQNVRKPLPPSDTPAVRLADWLKARGLRDGYGEYWSASEVSVVSRGAVNIRPIMEYHRHMIPYLCSVDVRWYQTPVQFVVIGDRNCANVNLTTVTKAFGPPHQTFEVEGYTVAIYQHNLTPLLRRSPWEAP